MSNKPNTIAIAALTVCAFMAGALFAGGRLPDASAQATSASLPPIFAVGNTVTFGPQGTSLSILQVHGDWILVRQTPAGGLTPTDTEDDTSRFWLYVPSIQNSWRLVEAP